MKTETEIEREYEKRVVAAAAVAGACVALIAPRLENENDFRCVGEFALQVKQHLKHLESEREIALAPARLLTKSITDAFAPARSTLLDADTHARKLLSDYETRRAAREVVQKARADSAASTLRESSAEPVVIPLRVSAATATVCGVSYRDHWSVTITDRDALIAACAANEALRGLLVVDVKTLSALAKAQKENFKIPGCSAVNTKSVVLR